MAFEPITINTQEEYDSLVKERIDRARKSEREKYAGYDDYKAKAEAYDTDIAERDKTIAANADKIKDLEAKVQTYERDSAKTNAALNAGLPLSMASRLQGNTADELKADAEALAQMLKPAPAPLADPDINSKPDESDTRAALRRTVKKIRKDTE